MNFTMLEQSIIFQEDIDDGWWDGEYWFCDFGRTCRHFDLTINEVIELFREEYCGLVIFFQAEILFNCKPTLMCSNIIPPIKRENKQLQWN